MRDPNFKFKRICRKCGIFFRPTGRYQRVCYNCMDRVHKNIMNKKVDSMYSFADNKLYKEEDLQLFMKNKKELLDNSKKKKLKGGLIVKEK